MAAMFDDHGGQSLYQAALREIHAGTLCPECKHSVRWRFGGYVEDHPGGQAHPVRMVVGVCEECGYERKDNADLLEDASRQNP
jgi:C4-type Zn-finger protein